MTNLRGGVGILLVQVVIALSILALDTALICLIHPVVRICFCKGLRSSMLAWLHVPQVS